MATPLRPVETGQGRRRLSRSVMAAAAVVTLGFAGVACSSDSTDEDPSDPPVAPDPAGEDPVEDPITDDGSLDE